MEKSRLLRFGVYPLIILATAFWGMSYIWTTIVFRYYNPLTTIFLRLLLSSIILITFIIIAGKAERMRKEDRWLFLVSAFFNPFLYFLGENFGLKNTTPTISSVVIATIPVFTAMAGYYFLKEKLSALNVTGIMLSFLGIGIMIINPDFSLNSPLNGVILLLGAVTSAVIYTVFLKKLAHKYSALTIIAYQNIIGLIYFLPIFLIFDFRHFVQVSPNFELISSLVQLALFASTLAFIFFTISVKEIGISRTGVFSNLMPVITAIFSAIFISESFSATKIAGIALVISGVMITQVAGRRKQIEPEI